MNTGSTVMTTTNPMHGFDAARFAAAVHDALSERTSAHPESDVEGAGDAKYFAFRVSGDEWADFVADGDTARECARRIAYILARDKAEAGRFWIYSVAAEAVDHDFTVRGLCRWGA